MPWSWLESVFAEPCSPLGPADADLVRQWRTADVGIALPAPREAMPDTNGNSPPLKPLEVGGDMTEPVELSPAEPSKLSLTLCSGSAPAPTPLRMAAIGSSSAWRPRRARPTSPEPAALPTEASAALAESKTTGARPWGGAGLAEPLVAPLNLPECRALEGPPAAEPPSPSSVAVTVLASPAQPGLALVCCSFRLETPPAPAADGGGGGVSPSPSDSGPRCSGDGGSAWAARPVRGVAADAVGGGAEGRRGVMGA